MDAAIVRRKPWYSSSSRIGIIFSMLGSKTTPSSTSVAAIIETRRIVSSSSPRKNCPRMSMSRVIRRAPNWASNKPPLRTKNRPHGKPVKKALEHVLDHELVGRSTVTTSQIAQFVVDTTRCAVTCWIGHQAMTASTAGRTIDIALSLPAMRCRSATPTEPERRK